MKNKKAPATRARGNVSTTHHTTFHTLAKLIVGITAILMFAWALGYLAWGPGWDASPMKQTIALAIFLLSIPMAMSAVEDDDGEEDRAECSSYAPARRTARSVMSHN